MDLFDLGIVCTDDCKSSGIGSHSACFLINMPVNFGDLYAKMEDGLQTNLSSIQLSLSLSLAVHRERSTMISQEKGKNVNLLHKLLSIL